MDSEMHAAWVPERPQKLELGEGLTLNSKEAFREERVHPLLT